MSLGGTEFWRMSTLKKKKERGAFIKIVRFKNLAHPMKCVLGKIM